MFNIFSHQRNSNQNYTEIPSHHDQENKNKHCEDVRMCVCGKNPYMLLVQTLWKSVWRFLENLKIELPHDWALPKPVYNRDTCTYVFIKALLTTIAKYGISLVVHNGKADNDNVVYIHDGVVLRQKGEWNYIIYRKMDTIGDHEVKWSKPGSDKYQMFSLKVESR
jgi:hypothetical protein